MKRPRQTADSWSWKPCRETDPTACEPGSLLLYEPGNWGDLLKGAWAVTITEHCLAASATGQAFDYVDPFAGAPTYPVSEATAQRARAVAGSRLAAPLQLFLAAGRWPSTASLVAEVCRRTDRKVLLHLYEEDRHRAQAWCDSGQPVTPGLSSPEMLLDSLSAAGHRPDLLLVDPYDLFDHWGRWMGRLEPWVRRAAVLIYLYNKSLRSTGHENQYRRLRRRLESLEVPYLLGRIAADAVAPRACHEVVLLGTAAVLRELKARLEEEIQILHRAIACDRDYCPFEEGTDGGGFR